MRVMQVVETNALISLAKRGVRVIHSCALYMGACYTWNFMWVVIIVTGSTERTGKNSGGPAKIFRQRSCGPVTFSAQVLTLHHSNWKKNQYN